MQFGLVFSILCVYKMNTYAINIQLCWKKRGFRPAGRGRDGCYFLIVQKVTKESLGVAFDERLRAAGAHRRLTPKPPITGDALLEDGHLRPAAPNTRLCILLAPGHRALPGVKFESVRVIRTPPTLAKPWQLGSCWGR
jgi:hypothetical protein